MMMRSSRSCMASSSQDQWKLAEQRLLHDFARQIHDFRFELLDNGLVLRGRTKTYYAKQRTTLSWVERQHKSSGT
jgi:hypothetical protein